MLDLTFHALGTRGKRCCRLRVFYLKRQVGHTTVIFRTAVATHPPPDVLSLVNHLHRTYHIDPDRLIWVNHFPATRRFWFFAVPERFERLHLHWNGDAFTTAIPEPLTPADAHALIGTPL